MPKFYVFLSVKLLFERSKVPSKERLPRYGEEYLPEVIQAGLGHPLF
jgi:hypothetical protein